MEGTDNVGRTSPSGPASGAGPRVDCVRCSRPVDHCVCDRVVQVDNRIGVTILQHPGERRHAFNTARLARAVLRNAELHIVWPDAAGRLKYPGPIPAGAALLYPRHDAVELGALPAADRPRHLIVIDGTWSQVRRLVRDNPWLDGLPHLKLDPATPSRYRIRREPAPHCLSTIEAIAAALGVLEPGTARLGGMLDGFLAMVEGQVPYVTGRAAAP